MLVVRMFAALALLFGCDAIFRIDHVEAMGPADADRFDCAVVGAGFIQACAGGPALNLTGAVSTDNNCAPVTYGASTFCLLVGDQVTVGDLAAVGSLPLVIAARHQLDLTGILDASSLRIATGPGARACATPPGPDNMTAAGGGPGASGRTTGGRGGADAANVRTPAPVTLPPTRELRGGCEGGTGGVSGALGGTGGFGGGAVYLIAGDAIVVAATARITASGEGGRGGHLTGMTTSSGGGGGGGGAGGMIVLDAPVTTLDLNAQMWANGGGGGAGGTRSAVGLPGGESTQPPSHGAGAPPNGGAGATGNGAGTDGGIYTALPPPAYIAAGGGGGGGTGWIFYYGATIAPALDKISPPPAAGP